MTWETGFCHTAVVLVPTSYAAVAPHVPADFWPLVVKAGPEGGETATLIFDTKRCADSRVISEPGPPRPQRPSRWSWASS
ncbi:MAG: hypothetical protein M3N24_08965 [Actinomycetota bacterium]|nr:hypothetical protein [Actinomycetota bacterium]